MGTPILNYVPTGGLPPADLSTALLPQGFLFYWPAIQNLTGGTLTDLDGQNISVLPEDSLIIVIIANRGESQWLRVLDVGSPVTNTDTGVICPVNYDSAVRPYVLHRQIGF